MRRRVKVIGTFWISLALAVISLVIFQARIVPEIAVTASVVLAVVAAVATFFIWFGVGKRQSSDESDRGE